MAPAGDQAPCQDRCMFARYFVELPIDPRRIERALTDAPARWLTSLASEAHQRGDTLLAEVGFGERVRVARQVTLAIGDPLHTAGKTVIPLRWEPTDAPGLFPALEADLEVAPLAPDRTQLAMSARYVPPLGSIGQIIDRSILYRVAEATLKHFLDRIADALVLEADLAERWDVAAGAD
jgi:hypothetical protein